jgi:hypothetical protein
MVRGQVISPMDRLPLKGLRGFRVGRSSKKLADPSNNRAGHSRITHTP